MRTIFFLLLGVAFCVMVCFIVVLKRINHSTLFTHGTSIRISETKDRFELDVRYPARLAHRLKYFIDNRLQPEFFSNEHQAEYITLNDRTRFEVTNFPGRLSIRLDKKENSPSACNRIRELSAGITHQLEH